MSTTASLTGQFTLVDSTPGAQPLVKQLSNLSFVGSVSELSQSTSLANGANVITLAISPVQFLYIKNLHASNTISVTWTPTGGTSAIICTLEPGSAISYINTTTGGGITALTLTASGASTGCEYLLIG